MSVKPVIKGARMASRIRDREDNPIFKYSFISDIIKMYEDEVRKALLKGERVEIKGVGTLIPEVKVHKGNYNMPVCKTSEGNPPPIAKIRFTYSRNMEQAINEKLKKNMDDGLYGLQRLPFTRTDFAFLQETGYIPEDEEYIDYREERDEDEYDE